MTEQSFYPPYPSYHAFPGEKFSTNAPPAATALESLAFAQLTAWRLTFQRDQAYAADINRALQRLASLEALEARAIASMAAGATLADLFDAESRDPDVGPGVGPVAKKAMVRRSDPNSNSDPDPNPDPNSDTDSGTNSGTN